MEDKIDQPRTPEEIARDGGERGAIPLGPGGNIIHSTGTGDEAIERFEKTHGSMNIPAYLRKPTLRKPKKPPFSGS